VIVYRQNPRTAGRVLDGQAFVITPDDQRLHQLNGAASVIWSCAADGCTIEQAAEAITDRYEVDLETARRDVAACCEDLVTRAILLMDDAPSAASG